MTERTLDQDLTIARIGRLEQESRTLKRIALACLLVIACIGLMGQTRPRRAPAPKPTSAPPPAGPKIVEAESFVLKDANGRVRAELSMAGTGPTFKLRDESGSALVTLSLNDGAPRGSLLLLSDPQHRASASWSVLEGGGPQFSLTGERPDIQVHMGVAPDGTTLELSDKDGFTTSIGSVPVTKNGQFRKTSAASVVLFGKERKVLWSAP